MKHWRIVAEDLIAGHRRLHALKPRRPRRVELSCDPLEERVTPSHFVGAVQHLAVAALGPVNTLGARGLAGNTAPPSPVGSTHGVGGNHSTNSTLQTALQTLRKDVQTIELASGTTVGQLTAIKVAFRTLATDGLTPSSRSALSSFENGLVTAYASGTTLAGDATLLSQFEAIYTSSPTTQQTTDLTTAYNALAAAVTSSNITSTDITTLNTDWAAVLAASNSTSTATFPYFTLVTGQGISACNGPMAF
ncbi:MAG: hypothetical protein JO114_14105 [Planctomycetaceae bacterium]|nr:hypothetical protein [Planctomycetaceae bacterium]